MLMVICIFYLSRLEAYTDNSAILPSTTAVGFSITISVLHFSFEDEMFGCFKTLQEINIFIG